MEPRQIRILRLLSRPETGCLVVGLAILLMCLMPIFFVKMMHAALGKLHLAGPVCVLLVIGILIGGMINLPVRRLERHVVQQVPGGLLGRLMGWVPISHPVPTQTVIAVNVGGCLIPLGLALYESLYVVGDAHAMRSLGIVIVVNILVCYSVVRPVSGVGIMMPMWTSPLVAVAASWLLLHHSDFDSVRAPVAFVGGVLGPLVGADLLHLKDVTRVSTGMLSIGGAGKFDGIVLSGLMAALLA